MRTPVQIPTSGKQWEFIPHLPGKEYGEQKAKARALFLVRWFHVGEFYNWEEKNEFLNFEEKTGLHIFSKKSTVRNVLIILEKSIQCGYEHNPSSFSWPSLDTLSVRQRFWGVHEGYLHLIPCNLCVAVILEIIFPAIDSSSKN